MSSDLDQLPRFKPEYAWLHEAWVEALESGEYTQTRHTLRDNHGGGYCCLGVLQDVAEKHGKRLLSGWDRPSLNTADIDDLTGVRKYVLDPLTFRNDGYGDIKQQSFKQIARIIRNRMAPEVTA